MERGALRLREQPALVGPSVATQVEAEVRGKRSDGAGEGARWTEHRRDAARRVERRMSAPNTGRDAPDRLVARRAALIVTRRVGGICGGAEGVVPHEADA